MTPASGIYRSGDGAIHVIADMNPHHRMAALAKLRRDEPHRLREIKDLSEAVLEADAKRLTGA